MVTGNCYSLNVIMNRSLIHIVRVQRSTLFPSLLQQNILKIEFRCKETFAVLKIISEKFKPAPTILSLK